MIFFQPSEKNILIGERNFPQLFSDNKPDKKRFQCRKLAFHRFLQQIKKKKERWILFRF